MVSTAAKEGAITTKSIRPVNYLFPINKLFLTK